jgi:hypothetical protein
MAQSLSRKSNHYELSVSCDHIRAALTLYLQSMSLIGPDDVVVDLGDGDDTFLILVKKETDD